MSFFVSHVFYRANPVQAGSQVEFSQWLCHVHNVVNRRYCGLMVFLFPPVHLSCQERGQKTLLSMILMHWLQTLYFESC